MRSWKNQDDICGSQWFSGKLAQGHRRNFWMSKYSHNRRVVNRLFRQNHFVYPQHRLNDLFRSVLEAKSFKSDILWPGWLSASNKHTRSFQKQGRINTKLPLLQTGHTPKQNNKKGSVFCSTSDVPTLNVSSFSLPYGLLHLLLLLLLLSHARTRVCVCNELAWQKMSYWQILPCSVVPMVTTS